MNDLFINDLNTLAKSMSRYCVGMEGNVSGEENGNITIKASGSKLSSMSTNDWVTLDSGGNQLSTNDKRPSMELSFHTYLLSFEDVNFISHTHPINCLKVLCGHNSNSFAKYRLFPDQIIFNGVKSCLIPYAKPGDNLTQEIKVYVESFIEIEGYFPKLILLENHGIIACGKTIDDCIITTEICEKSAEIFNGTKNLRTLSEYDIKDLVNDDKEKYRKNLL